MLNEKQMEEFAVELINRLLKVVEEQKKTIVQYEGAIEGIKLFMQELKKKLEEMKLSDSDKTGKPL